MPALAIVLHQFDIRNIKYINSATYINTKNFLHIKKKKIYDFFQK